MAEGAEGAAQLPEIGRAELDAQGGFGSHLPNGCHGEGVSLEVAGSGSAVASQIALPVGLERGFACYAPSQVGAAREAAEAVLRRCAKVLGTVSQMPGERGFASEEPNAVDVVDPGGVVVGAVAIANLQHGAVAIAHLQQIAQGVAGRTHIAQSSIHRSGAAVGLPDDGLLVDHVVIGQGAAVGLPDDGSLVDHVVIGQACQQLPGATLFVNRREAGAGGGAFIAELGIQAINRRVEPLGSGGVEAAMKMRGEGPKPGGPVISGNKVEIGIGLVLGSRKAGIELKALQTVGHRDIDADRLRGDALGNGGRGRRTKKVIVVLNTQTAAQFNDILLLRPNVAAEDAKKKRQKGTGMGHGHYKAEGIRPGKLSVVASRSRETLSRSSIIKNLLASRGWSANITWKLARVSTAKSLGSVVRQVAKRR
jgi:hypothetical protein